MKSPFPGMDPYLGSHWRDVHSRLVIYAADHLQSSLPSDLRARVEERVFVESELGQRGVFPDVRVVERPRQSGEAVAVEEITATDPLVTHLADEPVTEGYIEIVDVGTGNRVVPAIEFISLANKTPGEGRTLYVQKQQELWGGGVNLVEIDSLRKGERVFSMSEYRIPPQYRTPYQIVVRRSWKPMQAEYYPASLRERLPIISVPLRETDDDAKLDLQALIEQCYRNGAYDDLNYSVPANPPLEGDDDAWASALLGEKGLR
ncbi:MAG: hypothetical protein CMJ64_14215 [Planctomycetaceae bacterium]|nr:hypothetical protein [Planctomycetaceae bacterium]